MSIEAIRSLVLQLPEVADWPQVAGLLDRELPSSALYTWDYCRAACLAVGGSPADSLPGEAAILCSLLSIHLVDDVLDEDERGLYRKLGAGQVANMALGLQGAAGRLLAGVEGAERRAAMLDALSRMNLATAWGQHLDVSDLPGEEAYWRVARAKTPPLFGCGLYLGAVLGGASLEQAGRIAELGLPFGEIIQVGDDLGDALHSPACPDWKKQGGSLAILYARLAPHGDREEFARLTAQIDHPGALEAAQEILVRSGAVSYCAYHILQAQRRAVGTIRTLELAAPSFMDDLLARHVGPLMNLLRRVGIESPESLLLEPG
jgi:geranylgeranyl pyrophosphate synthase